MSDIQILEYRSLAGVTMDLLQTDVGDLGEGEELATAVRVALGTDALAGKGDVLPDIDSTDRRGWWGDLDAQEIWDGWPIGCKNWLLARAKITDAISVEGSTMERARNYTIDALRPFVDKRVASDMTVSVARTKLDRIEVHSTIYRGPLLEIDLRYQLLWEKESEKLVFAFPALFSKFAIRSTLIASSRMLRSAVIPIRSEFKLSAVTVMKARATVKLAGSGELIFNALFRGKWPGRAVLPVTGSLSVNVIKI